MDPAAPQINYQNVLSEFIHRQTIILGPHITSAKLSHVKGITIDPKGYLKKIHGDPEKILEEVVAQFKPLSRFLVKDTLEKILSQHQSLTSFDRNMPAIPTSHPEQVNNMPHGTSISHPNINPMNPLATKPTSRQNKHHLFGLFDKTKHTDPQITNTQPEHTVK